MNPHKQRLSGSCRAARDQRAGEEKGTKNRGNMLEKRQGAWAGRWAAEGREAVCLLYMSILRQKVPVLPGRTT